MTGHLVGTLPHTLSIKDLLRQNRGKRCGAILGADFPNFVVPQSRQKGFSVSFRHENTHLFSHSCLPRMRSLSECACDGGQWGTPPLLGLGISGW